MTLTQCRRQARAARAMIEGSLGNDVASWSWLLSLSRWIDALVTIEDESE